MSPILSWLHVLGAVISLGCNIFFVLILFPSVRFITDEKLRLKILANTLKYYHPLFLFGICLTFVTGAIRLTDLKIDFGSLYYGTFGNVLLWKFAFTMMIFLVAGGQCFGMGLKLQRMANGVIEGSLERQNKIANALKKMALYNIFLLAAAIYFGLKLMPMVYAVR